MSYLKGHSKIEIYLENAADLTAEGNTKLGEKSVMVITSATRKYSEMMLCVMARKKELRFLDLWMKKDSPLAKKLKLVYDLFYQQARIIRGCVLLAENVKGAAYSYAMCYMEEMLWMRTKSISVQTFSIVHLKLLKKDTNVTVLKGKIMAELKHRTCRTFLT